MALLKPENQPYAMIFRVHNKEKKLSENNLEIKNNDSLHFCTTEIYVPQEYFRMCYIRRQLMFCCDHVVDDVRG